MQTGTVTLDCGSGASWPPDHWRWWCCSFGMLGTGDPVVELCVAANWWPSDGALWCSKLVTEWWSFVLQQTGDRVMELCVAANWWPSDGALCCSKLVTQWWSFVLQQTWVLSCTAMTTARFHTAKCCELMIICGGLELISKFKQKLVLPLTTLRYAKDKMLRRQYNKT